MSRGDFGTVPVRGIVPNWSSSELTLFSSGQVTRHEDFQRETPGRMAPTGAHFVRQSVKFVTLLTRDFGTMPVRSAFFLHRHSLPPASLATDHSSLATRHSPLATRHYSEPLLFVPSGVNPAALRTVRLFPARPIRLFCTACWTVRSCRSVSVCQRTHTAPLRGLSNARAFTSSRIGKEHPHDPDILSLWHDCPTLAGFSGKWSFLDGRSAMATGWFPSLSDGVRGPSHPPGGCSVTRPPTCRVTRPRAWFQASILNRFASSLAGG